ncbi:MAG: hypothetical protein ACK4NH_04750 [Gemmobacter sp.]|nr:hypothetical protein [Gemmobacter sp.]
MAEASLTKTRVRAGIWEGVLTGAGHSPALEVWHLDQKLPGLTLTPLPDQPGSLAVQLPIPAAILSEGVQTLLFRDSGSGQVLAHFTIITGVAMEDDLRAEIDLLRAELDMLKRAFRRHCLETAG